MRGVILTGGRSTIWNGYRDNRTVHYDINGFVKDLPDLRTGRMDHACSFYYHKVIGGKRRVSPDFITPIYVLYEKIVLRSSLLQEVWLNLGFSTLTAQRCCMRGAKVGLG